MTTINADRTTTRLQLPAGTVTFLLFEVEDPHRFVEGAKDGGRAAIAAARALLEGALMRNGAVRPAEQAEADGIVGVFARASEALAAALKAHREFRAREWPGGVELQLRAALHTSEAALGDQADYAGVGLTRCIRLCAIAGGGETLLSGAARHLVVDQLPDGLTLLDLGAHRLRELGPAEHVWGVADLDLHPGLPRLRSLDGIPNNLPEEATSFIGRRRELEEVCQALSDARLLTLTGAGGCGKSRLALRVAGGLVDHFPGGAWWIELTPVGADGLVGATIAEALGVRPPPGITGLQAACGHLASRRALVILDNCEHLLAGVGEAVEAVLQAAPDVSVLATSRSPLERGDEVTWRVPSLSLPSPEGVAPQALTTSDAARLFVERAVGVRPNFAVTNENAPAVAEICRDLDGIPLAIELAAARIRMLSVDQLATRLSDRFRLLTGPGVALSARHRTLRASVDWSHDLLDADERILFRRLSVFTGGFTLDAAEEVCSGDGLDRYVVLDLLTSLVDKSLVVMEERGATMRYRMLETVRQYGLDRLAESGEEAAVRDRHLDAFLAIAERAAPHLEMAGQGEWVEVLDPEGANLAAAIDQAARSAPVLALRLCGALFMWWRTRRPYVEVDATYARVLECAEAAPASARAAVLWGRAYIDVGSGEFEAARLHATEAVSLADEAGDAASAARALCALGLSEAAANPASARPNLIRASKLARDAEDEWALVEASQFTALSYLFQDDHDGVERHNQQAAALVDEIGDPGQAARGALIAGSVALLDGRLDEALATFEGGYRTRDVVPDRVVDAWIDAQIALVDLLRGRAEEAREHLLQQLETAFFSGAGMAIPAILTWTGWADIATGRLDEARGRLQATAALVEGRDCLLSMWSHWLLGESLRLLGDDGAADAARHARATGEQVGNRLAGTRGSMTLARLAAAEADWSTAEHHALEHLDAVVEGGHQTFVPYCLDALSEIAAGLRSHEEAVGLLAAGAGARERLGVARWTPEEKHWEGLAAELRDAVGEDRFEAAWAIGADLSIDEALGWARRARGARKRPPAGWESLTPTELQVVELVARGMSNPQVAERMFISRATVKVHVAHVFQKLGVHTRAELAAHAARREK